jgi:hypothetical protein
MNSDWLEALQRAGLNGSMETAGDIEAEVRAAAGQTIMAPLTHLGLIEAQGEDASSFLHNLLTNDVNSIAADGVRRAGFCTPKGRLLADFLIWRKDQSIVLQLSADLLPAMLKKLSMYVLRAKAKLSDATPAHALIGLAGPQAVELLGQLSVPAPTPLQSAVFDGGMVIGLGEQRFELMVDVAKAASVWQQLAEKARPVGIAAWRSLDIAAGTPLITAATTEQFVPQMINYELIGGVGFKKGCYPGQEIVARTQYLGKIKRRMYRVNVGANLSAGESVYSASTGDQACGTVVLTAPSPEGGTDALLVAQISSAGSEELHIGNPAGPVPRLLALPYSVD